MVSFDVKCLFTNDVPIDDADALMILMERLQNDETLGDRTNLDPLCTEKKGVLFWHKQLC